MAGLSEGAWNAATLLEEERTKLEEERTKGSSHARGDSRGTAHNVPLACDAVPNTRNRSVQ
jgi:hypothetical protein